MTFKEFFMAEEELKPTQEMIDWFDERTNRHIGLVQKYAKKLEEYDPERFEGLSEQCKDHDASKFEEPEYTPYIFISWDYRCKDLKKEFTIPKSIKDQMNGASLHHVVNNKHHPESCNPDTAEINRDDRDEAPSEIIDATTMADMDIFEMLCDFSAMSEEKHNTVRSWCDKNINKRWQFTEPQTILIYDIIKILEEMEEE